MDPTGLLSLLTYLVSDNMKCKHKAFEEKTGCSQNKGQPGSNAPNSFKAKYVSSGLVIAAREVALEPKSSVYSQNKYMNDSTSSLPTHCHSNRPQVDLETPPLLATAEFRLH